MIQTGLIKYDVIAIALMSTLTSTTIYIVARIDRSAVNYEAA